MTHLEVGYAYISIFLPPSCEGSTYIRRTTGVETLLILLSARCPKLFGVYTALFTTTVFF